MIEFFKNILIAKKLAKYKCKLSSGVSNVKSNAQLIIESHVSISRISITAKVVNIGAHSYIRSGCEIHGDCHIGRFCSIANNVVIGLSSKKHPIKWLSTSLFNQSLSDKYAALSQSKTTYIGHDCWIGRDAIIMAGVTVGDGAVIGARALVTRDVPSYAIVAGIPAKIIKYRFSQHLIQKLSDSKWWIYQAEKIACIDVENPQLALEQIQNFNENDLAKYKTLLITKGKVVVT